MTELQELERKISFAMRSDQYALRRFLKSIRRAEQNGRPFSRNLTKLNQQLEASLQLRERRAASVPEIGWPDDLPVVARRSEIADAIRDHQVIVVCGETGSGKSTQLPKIALDLGRGVGGVIGHTQPRRIAARSVATRIADELNTPLGKQVGYRIRFNDASGPGTLIRLMTDGILLAETQSDRFLDQYDTIIVDEAHERSLNIDFLLGYLKRLLPRRRDLRVIITSATIDAERFAQHFGTQDAAAPVILVEGRTFPVEIRYRPLNEEPADVRRDSGKSRQGQNGADVPERDWLDGVADAVSELAESDAGHILVFLPTERDIREADRRLSGKRFHGDTDATPTQIVPLFGRLSMADQSKVFQPYSHRRIVLATNVAESSLTVPGIRSVIDTGTARISRYSVRSRIQRLPIEPVSRASARQRSGRCGRVGPGVCIRLFSEADFNSREEFTAPEIQRTNLAAVILRTMNLKLGRLEEFPFLDPPRPTTIREGYRTLEELGAIASRSGAEFDYELTEIGRRMARLPVDPRISRMILAAVDEQAVPEVLAIASALEIQDPRERPIEKQQAADEAHQAFQHEESDFLTLLNLWDAWHRNKSKLSSNQLKKWCRRNFLSWMRMREWVDVHRQLRDLLAESGEKSLQHAAALHPLKDRRNDFAAIHRALMTGLLANLAYRSGDREYTGAGGNKLTLWPGSTLAKKGPKWLVAAELIETSQRFARTMARIQPQWIERLAEHLVKREYTEPHWDAAAGNVMCFEKVTLWGLPIVPRRKTPYARINATRSRELLIQYGLVELALLHGQTEDDRPSDYSEEERELTSGSRSRITPGRSLRADPQSAAFRSEPADTTRGWGKDFPFLRHNVGVLEQVRELQARTRQHDLLPTEQTLYDLYDAEIPGDVADRVRLRRWYQRASRTKPSLLKFDIETFVTDAQRDEGSSDFPASITVGAMTLPLSYQLDPGCDADGVTVSVPCEAVGQLEPGRLTWLVPGLVEAKVTELIRSLPRDLRRNFVPAPDTARQVCAALTFAEGNLHTAVAAVLSRIAGEPVQPESFNLSALPRHLLMNIRVIDNDWQTVAENRNLFELRNHLQAEIEDRESAARSPEEEQWCQRGFTSWDFPDLPPVLNIQRAGMELQAYPAIRDDGESVGLMLCQTPEEAIVTLRRGLRRLFLLTDRERIDRQIEHLPDLKRMKKLADSVCRIDLKQQLSLLLVERAYLSPKDVPRDRVSFETFLQDGRRRISVVVQELLQLIPGLLRQAGETLRNLNDATGPGRELVLADLRRQFSRLIYARFLEDTPWPWLIQFPRYLTCIRMRLDRLNSGGAARENALLSDFAPYQDRYLMREQELKKERRASAMLDHYRWMLEEFRVSLFAQKLGTAIRVSGRKLDEQWERVR